MIDTYTVNGTDLTTPWWWLDTPAELIQAPEIRGEDPLLPGLHGVLDMDSDLSVPRRRYGAGRIKFRLQVVGIDKATLRPPVDEDDTSALDARVGELTALFAPRQLALFRPASGRRATAKLASGASFTVERQAGTWPQLAIVEADCVIPGAFWRPSSAVTMAPPSPLATGGSFSLAALAGSNAPIVDALVRFGAASNPRLVLPTSRVGYMGVIASGRTLDVDCATWETLAGPGTAWTPSNSLIDYGPGPSWLEIDPTASLTAVLQHTGGGTATCQITALPRYLTS